jgi:hypothetical protein
MIEAFSEFPDAQYPNSVEQGRQATFSECLGQRFAGRRRRCRVGGDGGMALLPRLVDLAVDRLGSELAPVIYGCEAWIRLD